MKVDISLNDRSASQTVTEVKQIREFFEEYFISHICLLFFACFLVCFVVVAAAAVVVIVVVVIVVVLLLLLFCSLASFRRRTVDAEEMKTLLR